MTTPTNYAFVTTPILDTDSDGCTYGKPVVIWTDDYKTPYKNIVHCKNMDAAVKYIKTKIPRPVIVIWNNTHSEILE